jgi:hypothetical protein
VGSIEGSQPQCSASSPMQATHATETSSQLTRHPPLPPFLLVGIDLMVFNTLKERWVAKNRAMGNTDRTPDVMTLVYM